MYLPENSPSIAMKQHSFIALPTSGKISLKSERETPKVEFI